MSERRETVEVELEEISDATLKFTTCEHFGARHFKLKVWNDVLEFKIPEVLIRKVDTVEIVDGICPECFALKVSASAIRCCKCGKTILAGDSVSLYPKNSEGVDDEIAEYIETSAIGCMKIDCCPSAGFFAGHWTANGFKPLFRH